MTLLEVFTLLDLATRAAMNIGINIQKYQATVAKARAEGREVTAEERKEALDLAQAAIDAARQVP